MCYYKRHVVVATLTDYGWCRRAVPVFGYAGLFYDNLSEYIETIQCVCLAGRPLCLYMAPVSV
jgi:hypothetical protein